MSNFEDVKIERKHSRTVGNFNCNGDPITATSTTCAKFSLSSTDEHKSVVSSLSMSLERKESIHFISKKVAPYTIPAGQNTVIHLDNYTHFMGNRVITKKTAVKRTQITSEDHNSIVSCVTKCEKNKNPDDMEVDSTDILDSSCHSNNKSFLNINKKVQDSICSTPSKLRGRRGALALDYKKSKELKINMKKHIPPISIPIKPIVTKPSKPTRKRIIKPRQPRKSKIKTINEAKQAKANDKIAEVTPEKSQTLLTTSAKQGKILRPCVYTMQSKKCLSEMTCPYLHSDFPCKYYYLNIPCPKDFKCQFMHNGPIEPNMKEALRNHILDLLSPKPSAAETHFVQQIHYIEDLSNRLQSFQVVKDKNNEIIEVMDDVDEDQVLSIDESSNSNNPNNIDENTITNSELIIDNRDLVYEKFKETNNAVNKIDKKLKKLKNTSNISANEKIHQLEIIYNCLTEQEKRVKNYESINAAIANTQVDDTCSNVSLPLTSANLLNEQPHIVLVDTDIVNEVQNSVFDENGKNLKAEENLVTTAKDESVVAMNTNVSFVDCTEFSGSEEDLVVNLTLDENSLPETEQEYFQTTNLNTTQPVDIKHCNQQEEDAEDLMNLSNLPKLRGVEPITVEMIPQTDVDCNDGMPVFTKDIRIHDLNISSDKGENIDNNYLTISENYETMAPDNGVIGFSNTEFLHGKFEYENSDESLEKNSSETLYKNNSEITVNSNTSSLYNETLELEITNDEKEVIENVNDNNNAKEISSVEVDDQSQPPNDILSSKPEKRSRIGLRSHKLPEREEITNEIACKKLSDTISERIKPIRRRRLRLPKPSQKSTVNSIIEECQIKADVINKLIESEGNNTKETNSSHDVENPLPENVILTKRFLKKAKAKHLKQLKETKIIASNNDIDTNVEQNMLALHNNYNKNHKNIDVSLLNQTSDDSNILNPLQDPLVVEGNNDRGENITTESCETPNKAEDFETLKKQKLRCDITFENPSSSLGSSPTTDIKEKYNLGNPQVVLNKLNTLHLPQKNQKDIQADSTTSYVNPMVTSLSANDKSKQKRCSFTTEIDLDSSLKESKYLKIDNTKSVGEFKIDDNRKLTLTQQSDQLKGKVFETDSCDEKLTTTPSHISIHQQESFDSSQNNLEQHQNTLRHEHIKEQPENEFDLRQEIENVSNKSDLQLKTQQPEQERFKQQKEVEETSKTTTTSFISKNSNNFPHKQIKQQDNSLVMEKWDEKDLVQQKQYEENKTKEGQIAANTCNSYNDNIEKDEDGHTQSFAFESIYEPEKLQILVTSNLSNKYSNEEDINVKYSTYSSLFNKLTKHSTKCQINFENSTVNITPISSPTYGNDTISSPSPMRKLIDFRTGGELDGRLTYPSIPYILHEIDLEKIEINKPLFLDKFKTTIQMDPRIFRTHIKKQSMTLSKPIDASHNALVKSTNYFNLSNGLSSFIQPTTSMMSPYDPRSRMPAVMTDITTPSLPHQTALTPYNSLQTAVTPSSSLPFMQASIPNTVPLALQYHSTAQPFIQPQQQQTPNMLLYSCLQRSPWYQSLISTMKIQINQSISQLVRALNNFHRERVFNPEIVFDVFKIDCAGELLEIMQNLDIFVDANGIINEKRNVPSFGGRSCCNALPVNATYSFIQQVLTPNMHCPSTKSSSNCGAVHGSTHVCHINANEPFVSCYIKESETTQKHSDICAASHNVQHDNNNKNCINNHSDNDNNSNNNNNNNYNSGRRYSNQLRKPYDNTSNNNCQQRSNQRSSYNNNPRFMKPGACSPSKLNTSPSNSPRRGSDSGNGSSFGGRGGRGGGGRFNNNRRFNNFNNNDNNNNNDSSSWNSSGSNQNRYNNKYQNNNSPPRSSSPNTSFQSRSPRSTETETKTASPPLTAPKPNTNISDEESWD